MVSKYFNSYKKWFQWFQTVWDSIYVALVSVRFQLFQKGFGKGEKWLNKKSNVSVVTKKFQ